MMRKVALALGGLWLSFLCLIIAWHTKDLLAIPGLSVACCFMLHHFITTTEESAA
jgi:hypothetical protein